MTVIDPFNARILVYHTVVNWVGPAVGLPPQKVNVSRTFVDAPTKGYGFNEGRYLQMCDQISAALTISSGRLLKLPGTWRLKHEQDDIATFINEVAILLLAAPATAVGKAAHSWLMQ